MKLYHGTSSSYLKKILREGLKPRGKRKGNWGPMASIPEAVYLTNAYAIHFARCCAVGRGRYCIVEIDVEKADFWNFIPDEDFLEQALRDNPEYAPFMRETLEERTAWCREAVQDRFSHIWEVSLESLGNCAHLGPIAPEAITKIALIKHDHPLSLNCDPTITLMNYKIMGPWYRNSMRHLFGNSDFEADPINDVERLRAISREGIEVIEP